MCLLFSSFLLVLKIGIHSKVSLQQFHEFFTLAGLFPPPGPCPALLSPAVVPLLLSLCMYSITLFAPPLKSSTFPKDFPSLSLSSFYFYELHMHVRVRTCISTHACTHPGVCIWKKTWSIYLSPSERVSHIISSSINFAADIMTLFPFMTE